MKKTFLDDERVVVNERGSFKLKHFPTDIETRLEKKDLKEFLEKDRERISELQEVLYAAADRALLLVFQAMDAAGKDSCVRHVMSGVNPQGVVVSSFKAPSSLERSHDFLWRHHGAMPPRGFIGIHNRSHYEEVLVTRVHPEIIVGQRIPGIRKAKDIGKKLWEHRYESIRNFEEHLARNGTVIMKFFLHMSRAQQKRRFLERIDDPDKNWKFSANDVKERAFWDDYMEAYEAAISETATRHAPWYIIPADEQWESRALVGRLLRERLERTGAEAPDAGQDRHGSPAGGKKGAPPGEELSRARSYIRRSWRAFRPLHCSPASCSALELLSHRAADPTAGPAGNACMDTHRRAGPGCDHVLIQAQAGQGVRSAVRLGGKDEFRFDGEWYDVVDQRTQGHHIILRCVRDGRETQLMDRFIALHARSRPSDQEGTALLAHWIAQHYLGQSSFMSVVPSSIVVMSIAHHREIAPLPCTLVPPAPPPETTTA
jgi:PPK2 family polyphosphate:nucleotide phosphotransferase